MGLDIYHSKATLNCSDKITPENLYDKIILVEEYEGIDVPINYFKPYIQQIDYPVSVSTIILPKSESDWELAESRLSKYEYTFLFNQDQEILSKEIKLFEEKHQLSGLNKNQ